MQVILLEKVHKLGNLGDTIKVKPGYGRNFLIPRGKAVMATAANRAKFEARRAELEKAQADAMAAAQARAAQLAELGSVTITQLAGDEGKLFGSVGTADIADAITAAGVEVDRREVRLTDGPLRFLGDHEVEIAVHSDLAQAIVVKVVAQ